MNEYERELGKIQQQLDTAVENVSILRKSIDTLFIKLETDSKDTIREVSRIYESVNTHLGQLSAKIDNNSKATLQEINKIYTSLSTHLATTKDKRENCDKIFSKFSSEIAKLEIKLEDVDTNQQKLETSIIASLRTVKIMASIIGFIALLMSIASMVLTFLKTIPG